MRGVAQEKHRPLSSPCVEGESLFKLVSSTCGASRHRNQIYSEAPVFTSSSTVPCLKIPEAIYLLDSHGAVVGNRLSNFGVP